jgi:hypothetical protein
VGRVGWLIEGLLWPERALNEPGMWALWRPLEGLERRAHLERYKMGIFAPECTCVYLVLRTYMDWTGLAGEWTV